MKKTITILSLLTFFYLILIIPFIDYMRVKPFAEKVGYVPSVPVLKVVAADHKEFMGSLLVMKVLMYFGGLVDKHKNEMTMSPDYPAMSRMIHGAVQLDPYNMDAYYFGQAILVWDVGKVDIANELLDYGMRYRTWDWYLPFFAGFNYAYFLKDYSVAAKYYRRAGELSGSNLFKSLAGRYMQESGHTELALAYLTAMDKGEKNPAIRETYRIRIAAFKEVRNIEIARDKFKRIKGVFPASIDMLVHEGYLVSKPVDPYGGQFYLEPDGKVATTSKFAFAWRKRTEKKSKAQGAR